MGWDGLKGGKVMDTTYSKAPHEEQDGDERDGPDTLPDRQGRGACEACVGDDIAAAALCGGIVRVRRGRFGALLEEHVAGGRLSRMTRVDAVQQRMEELQLENEEMMRTDGIVRLLL